MNPEALFVLIGSLGGVMTVVVAVLGYRYTKRRDERQDGADAIKVAIDTALQPVKDTLGRADTKMAVLETKVDMLWMNLQKDMAKGIHSPDPRRAHIDYLMDKIIREEPMAQDEIDETKRILHVMINYEAGHSPDPGFPIKDGDPVYAAFLLRSFDIVPIPIRGKS